MRTKLLPLTHYHLGTGLFFGTVFFRFFYLPAMLAGSIFPDIEPITLVLYNYNYPYLSYPHHGALHSLLAGVFASLLITIVIKNIRWPFKGGNSKALIGFFWPTQKKTFQNIFFGALFGYFSHIIFDSIMHYDVYPFWPSKYNPLLRIVSVSQEYSLMYIMAIIGIALFAGRILWQRVLKRK